MADMISPKMRHMIEPIDTFETLYGLVIGERGVGKTTLVSELYKLHSDNDQKLISVKEKDNYYPISQGKNSFVLIDGLNYENTEEIHIIFIVIKYDTRFERMLTNYFFNEELIEKYKTKVVIMFSHWDYSKYPEKDFDDICEYFEEECPNIINMICYSDQNINEKLADMMFRCISNHKSAVKIPMEDELSIANDGILNETSKHSLVEEANSNQNISYTCDTKMDISEEKSEIIFEINDQDQISSLQSTDYEFKSTTENNEIRIYRFKWFGQAWRMVKQYIGTFEFVNVFLGFINRFNITSHPYSKYSVKQKTRKSFIINDKFRRRKL